MGDWILPGDLLLRWSAYAVERALWDFDVTVIRADDKIFRLPTAVPKGRDLPGITAILRRSLRRMTKAEAADLKPLRVRVVTANPGDTVQLLAERMAGTDRQLALFKAINELSDDDAVMPGRRYKIIAE